MTDVRRQVHSYLIPGHNGFEKIVRQAYWDIILNEISQKKYDTLLSLIQELKTLTISLIPNRTDLHKNVFDEYIDISFIKQKFEYNVFGQDDFIGLVTFWLEWIKQLGQPINDVYIEDLKAKIISLTREKGYLYVLPFAYDSLHTEICKINAILEVLRN